MRLTDLQNDHRSLRIGLVNERGIITSAYTCLKPFENSAYLQYLLHSYDTQKFFYGLGGGVRQSIGFKDIRYIKVPLPPREEQDQIVRFLDWRVSQINRLINTKEKQIVLLQEQKRAVINAAVTKGEEGWESRRLKTLVRNVNNTTSPKDKFYVGMENIVSWTAEYMDTGMNVDGDSKTFEVGDILFGKLRPYLAKIYMPDCEGVCSGEFLVLRDFKGYLPFLKYSLLSYDYIMLVNASTYGAKMPRANWAFIGNCSISHPSIQEQKEIVESLDKQCERINKLVDKFKFQISLLHEYRTRLISDVVTGKMDVRGVEIPQYEAVEEAATDEPMDDGDAGMEGDDE